MNNLRFRIVQLGMCLVAVSWIIYLGIVQFTDPFKLSDPVRVRYRPSKDIIFPRRGNIFDANGELLVGSRNYYQIDFDNRVIQNKTKNLAQLDSLYNEISRIVAPHSKFSVKQVKRKFEKNKGRSFFLSRNISESSIIKIERELAELKLLNSFIKTFQKSERTYTHGVIGARLIGLAAASANVKKNNSIYKLDGLCGLEASLNHYLEGEYGWRERMKDALKKSVPVRHLEMKEPKNGNSVHLTIDAKFQEILEEKLHEGLLDYGALNAMAVFMDVKTGQILAMASVNKKDPYQATGQIRSLPNLSASFLFEPGSTFKPFTSLLALEEDYYKTSDMIDCRTYKLPGRIIRDSHPFKKLSFKEVITFSSNVGISKVAEKVGSKALYNRLMDLGFGHRTEADLSNETPGILRKLSDWNSFSLHSISFGQEVSVSALQLANSYCTLANGGKVLRPQIVKKITDYEGKLISKSKPEVLRKISNKKDLDSLKVMLQSVVDYGTATSAKLDYISIAGKTGTAEKLDPATGKYSEDKYTSVFSGFFPVDNPQIAGVVIYDEPKYYYRFGSMSAAPTFKKIVKDYTMLPDSRVIVNTKKTNQKFVKSPDLVGKSLADVKDILKKNGLKYRLIVNDKSNVIVEQFPKPNVEFNPENKMIIVSGIKKSKKIDLVDNSIMPDLTKLSVRDAVKVARSRNLQVKVMGRGFVYYQSIKKKEKVKFGELCIIKARS